MTLRDLLKDIGLRLLQGHFPFDSRPAPMPARVPVSHRAGNPATPVRAQWPNTNRPTL